MLDVTLSKKIPTPPRLVVPDLLIELRSAIDPESIKAFDAKLSAYLERSIIQSRYDLFYNEEFLELLKKKEIYHDSYNEYVLSVSATDAYLSNSSFLKYNYLYSAFAWEGNVGSRSWVGEYFDQELSTSLLELGYKELKADFNDKKLDCRIKGHYYSALVYSESSRKFKTINELESGDVITIIDRGKNVYGTEPSFSVQDPIRVKKFFKDNTDVTHETAKKKFGQLIEEKSLVAYSLKLNEDELYSGKLFKEGICSFANRKAWLMWAFQIKYGWYEGLNKYKEFSTYNRVSTFEKFFLNSDIQCYEKDQIQMLHKIVKRLEKRRYNLRDKHHHVTLFLIDHLMKNKIKVDDVISIHPSTILLLNFIKTNSSNLFDCDEKAASTMLTNFVEEMEREKAEALESGDVVTFIQAGGYYHESITMEQVKKLKDEGFSSLRLLISGFSFTFLKNAGFTVADFKKDGVTFPSSLIYNHIYNRITKFVEPGINLDSAESKEVKSDNYLDEFVKAGFSISDLREAGYSIGNLKESGFTARVLRFVLNFSIYDLLESGFPYNDLRAAEFSTNDIAEAGYSVFEIIREESKSGKKIGEVISELPVELFTKQDTSGKTPLDNALDWGCYGIAYELLNSIVRRKPQQAIGSESALKVLLRTIGEEKPNEIVSDLIQYSPVELLTMKDPIHGMTALHFAIEDGKVDIAKRLIDSIKNKDRKKLTVLDEGGFSPLVTAFLKRNVNEGVISKLIEALKPIAFVSGVYYDDYQSTLLHKLILNQDKFNGSTEIIKELVQSMSDDEKSTYLSASDRSGNTPLIIAIRNGYEQTALLLIEHMAQLDPKLINKEKNPGQGDTALNLAYEYKLEKVANALIKILPDDQCKIVEESSDEDERHRKLNETGSVLCRFTTSDSTDNSSHATIDRLLEDGSNLTIEKLIDEQGEDIIRNIVQRCHTKYDRKAQRHLLRRKVLDTLEKHDFTYKQQLAQAWCDYGAGGTHFLARNIRCTLRKEITKKAVEILKQQKKANTSCRN